MVAFDCASDATSAAVLRCSRDASGFVVAGSARDEAGARHGGGVLLPLVAKLLQGAGADQENIAALVVGTGPGTFTGVRIAVSTGRALALALGRPVFGVSTLDVLAAQALLSTGAASWTGPESAGRVVLTSVVDARRRQVFAADYVLEPEGWTCNTVRAVDPEGVVSTIGAMHPGARVALVGAEALVMKGDGQSGALIMPQVLDAAHLVLGQEQLAGGRELMETLARACAGPCGQRIPCGGDSGRDRDGMSRAGEPGSPELVNPIYVRPPDADTHITKMRDPWGGR